jgi:hypothetical protein
MALRIRSPSKARTAPFRQIASLDCSSAHHLGLPRFADKSLDKIQKLVRRFEMRHVASAGNDHTLALGRGVRDENGRNRLILFE